MRTTAHLDLDEMRAYLADTEMADGHRISRHLAQCAACRSQVDTLAALKRDLGAVNSALFNDQRRSDEQLQEMLDTQAIEGFVDTAATRAHRQKIKESLSENPLALKAALHYASHKAAMDRALAPEVTPAKRTAARSTDGQARWLSIWTNVRHWLGRRIPLWTTLPAAALASGILILALTLVQLPGNDHLRVASYQDDPVVAFRAPNQAPGIGFFGTAAQRRSPFEPLAVVPTATGLDISWPQVPGANDYTLRLVRRENGGTRSIAHITTSVNSVSLKDLEIICDQRYVWTLSGTTTDQQTFYAEGGFIFHR